MAVTKNRSWIYLLAAMYFFAVGTLSYASFGSSLSIMIGAACYIIFLILVTIAVYQNRHLLR